MTLARKRPTMAAGVVVAGGRSTRFGEPDKALADLAGVPMVRRVADRIAPAIDALVLNCRADQREGLADALAGYDHPVSFAVDPEPDRGPMAGIRTGLRAAESEYAAVVACDMPFVDPALVAHLFERAAGRDGAVPRLDGYFEPIHAVYRADAMAAACDRALERGDRRIVAPFEDLEIAAVEGEELARFAGDSFENVNTREALADAAERVE